MQREHVSGFKIRMAISHSFPIQNWIQLQSDKSDLSQRFSDLKSKLLKNKHSSQASGFCHPVCESYRWAENTCEFELLFLAK